MLGTAGKAGGGYCQFLMQCIWTLCIENDSKQSFVDMTEKGQLGSFPTSRIYSKGLYDKLQDLAGSYLVVCESMDSEDMNFKNLRRIVASCEGQHCTRS